MAEVYSSGSELARLHNERYFIQQLRDQYDTFQMAKQVEACDQLLDDLTGKIRSLTKNYQVYERILCESAP